MTLGNFTEDVDACHLNKSDINEILGATCKLLRNQTPSTDLKLVEKALKTLNKVITVCHDNFQVKDQRNYLMDSIFHSLN